MRNEHTMTKMIANEAWEGSVYLPHAELTPLQGLTEAHLPTEEAVLVGQCGGLLTHRNAFGQVGVEADGNAVPDTEKLSVLALLRMAH